MRKIIPVVLILVFALSSCTSLDTQETLVNEAYDTQVAFDNTEIIADGNAIIDEETELQATEMPIAEIEESSTAVEENVSAIDEEETVMPVETSGNNAVAPIDITDFDSESISVATDIQNNESDSDIKNIEEIGEPEVEIPAPSLEESVEVPVSEVFDVDEALPSQAENTTNEELTENISEVPVEVETVAVPAETDTAITPVELDSTAEVETNENSEPVSISEPVEVNEESVDLATLAEPDSASISSQIFPRPILDNDISPTILELLSVIVVMTVIFTIAVAIR